MTSNRTLTSVAAVAAGNILDRSGVVLATTVDGKRVYQADEAARRAVVHYRISMLVILLVNALAAAVVWLLGVQFISGRGLWDYVTYVAPYGLNVIAAFCCFRLAAPPAISGKKAFFKRL